MRKEHQHITAYLLIKLLFYSGQYDFIVAAATTEAFLPTIPWKDIEGWKDSKKIIWKVASTDADVAGYVRQYSSLTHVIVRSGTKNGYVVLID